MLVNYLKSEERAQGVVRDIRQDGGEAFCHRADITDEGAVQEMFRTAREAFGPVNVLVNNALPDYKFDPVARKDFASIGWKDYLH